MVYKEMSLRSAALRFPFLLHIFPREMLQDEKYICRVSDDGCFEIGYKSDEWVIR